MLDQAKIQRHRFVPMIEGDAIVHSMALNPDSGSSATERYGFPVVGPLSIFHRPDEKQSHPPSHVQQNTRLQSEYSRPGAE
jgi:hypothetical protein